jgi:predicted transcriptional regulator
VNEDGSQPVVEYVTSSTTRESVVTTLAAESATTRALCSALDASESGVYAAVNDLREHGVLEVDDGERLRLTGVGIVVADAVERRQRLESTLRTDLDYWRTHDVRALPDPFRARLSELEGLDVFRVAETDPAGAIRLIHDSLRNAAEVAVVSPVHFPDLGQTLREVCEDRPGRLLVTEAVVDEVRRHDDGDVPIPENLTVRVASVSFALAVADGTTFLSLPRLDGSYDPSTELVADSDTAVRFGHDLFEWVWRDATPVGDVAPTRPL